MFRLTLLLLSVTIGCGAKYRNKNGNGNNNVHEYCMQMSLKMDPLAEEIIRRTINQLPMAGMLGKPEILQFGQNLLRLTRASRVLDIGTFTGLSAVSWALAIPDYGQVLTIDVNPTYYDSTTRALIETRPEVARKITRHIGEAVQKLDSLIAADGLGQWDFAFIDADKINYPVYYDRVMRLLRPGGVIVVDNALWGGRVASSTKDRSTWAIDQMNRRAANDTRADNYLFEIGDGAHIIFKNYLRHQKPRV